MPAKTVTLPAINQIPAPLTGNEFLASSHFKIGHDRRLAKSARRRSTFKKDYLPPPINAGRPPASEPPAPADVMHKDQFKTMDDVSETHTSFQDKGYGKVPMCNSLTTTNYKMDADKRIDSFRTTHSLYFTRKPMSKAKQKDSPMKSYIPDGDREKAAAPVSDYRDKYRGHDTNVVIVDRAPCMHTGGPATIKGDGRTHTFTTSSSDEFYGKYLPVTYIHPDTLGSNIPQGDMEKVVHHNTTQRLSYPKPTVSAPKHYDKTDAQQRTQGTNFKLGAANRYNRYDTTAGESYDPKIRESCELKEKPNMGVSSFPEGDLDPERVLQRISTTTSNVYLKKPPKDYRNLIVSGAFKRTASNVTFGEPKLSGDFYSTTEKDAFPPTSVPLERATSHHYTSDVPMDYYEGEVHQSTTWNDFPVHLNAPPLSVSKEEQIALRESHLTPPLHGERFFDTTHLTSYTPKTTARYHYDSGRLQRSSVPLGTFASIE
ncbi:stabilizer of axonemal microtubules 5-like [Ptychodera flava]|uniref:stabilizer of axonemal microtubules 5-like n=1 Tax=Ptychodera flava TaxID=63121 RepID=UPI00396AAFCA